MKRLAAAIIGLWTASTAAADFPFAPIADVPDYIALFNEKSNRTRIDSLLVRRHGEWVRIDSEVDNNYRETSYHRVSDTLEIKITHNSDDAARPRSLTILRGARPYRESRWDWTPVKTAERDVVLGEACGIWETGRITIDSAYNAKKELKRFSCVTEDGIELRNWFSSFSLAIAAVSLVRREIPAAEVVPPSDLFDLKTWLTEEPDPSTRPGDATVTMKSQPSGDNPRNVKTHITRRHFPWTRVDEIDPDGRRKGHITSESQRLHVGFETSPEGELTNLGLEKILPPLTPGYPRTLTPVSLGERDTILGEMCTWFDMWPDVMDAGRHECRTEDGLVLKERRYTRGSAFELVAVRVDREPVPLSQVSPVDVLARSNWGLPD